MRRGMMLVMLLTFAIHSTAHAEVKTEAIEYEYDGTKMKGVLTYDDAIQGKRPGILVVHEWWGLDAYARSRATQLAKLGYVALAADMYGEGKTTEHPKEAGSMAGMVRKNLGTWMGRANAGLKVLKNHRLVDATKLGAMGYCFGGSTALQLAHTASDVKVVVSFHGALPIPDADQLNKIKAKILICHGADDSFIPNESIEKVQSAYKSAKVDFEFISYPGAVHSFTVPDADKRGIKGIAYNADADHKSWESMQKAFKSAFGSK